MNAIFNSIEEKYFFKLSILVMISDFEPHENEYNLIYDTLEKKLGFQIDIEDFHEIVDEVNRNIFEYQSIRETAKRFANQIENKRWRHRILDFCEDVLWADGIKRSEEEEIISILKESWFLP